MSGKQLRADEERKTERDSSDSESSTNGCEPEREQSPAPLSRKTSQKNRKKPKNNDNPKVRKDKKKKFRKQNRAKVTLLDPAIPLVTSSPLAFTSGALPPTSDPGCSSAVAATHDSTSNIAAIAQKEVLRAIENVLL